MIRLSPAVRISLALVLITLGVLLLGNLVGLIPDQKLVNMEARKKAAESIAVPFTLAAQDNNAAAIKKTINALASMHPDIISLGMRKAGGNYFAQTLNHQAHWVQPPEDTSTSDHWQIPIYQGMTRWGTLEICFFPATSGFILMGYPISPFTVLVIFFGLLTFSGYLFFMKKTLRHLDPTTVMPGRVKSALDTLTEGVLLVDAKERIIMANQAFSNIIEIPVDSLMGTKASSLGWIDPDTNRPPVRPPWVRAIIKGKIQSEIPITYPTRKNGIRTFMANGAPILDDKGISRGALATFNDVTELKRRNTQLSEMLQLLQESQNEIQRQNKELEVLATQDPLTGCLNRRAFFAMAEEYMATSIAKGSNLACIMTDIDLFKSINDRYGHRIGDQVIQFVANTYQRELRRKDDIVCRYGGEEFCILLPYSDIEKAVLTADRLRNQLLTKSPSAIKGIPGISVASSFGVSEITLGAGNVDELIDQADSALYKAKETGRNKVVSWQTLKEEGQHQIPDSKDTGIIQFPN